VQAASTNNAGTSGVSFQFPTANTPGNLIVVVVSGDAPAGQLSVSDTAGNAYAAANSVVSAQGSLSVFYAVVGPVGGVPNAVTASSTDVTELEMSMFEYSGVTTLDRTNSAVVAVPCSTGDSGPVTTTRARELILGASYSVGTTGGGPGAGFTLLTSQVFGSLMVADMIVSSTVTQDATFNFSIPGTSITMITTFY
jgi:hypothetical protein